jgi:hypothetical protein
VLGGSGVEDDEEDWGRRPGKSGTSTVTSVNSTSKLGRGVVVVVVVVKDLAVVELDVTVVDVPFECSDTAVVEADETDVVEWLATLSTCSASVDVAAGLGVVVVVEIDAFCSPSVFQMDGPTDENQGGLGLAVDDVGVAIVSKRKNEFIKVAFIDSLICVPLQNTYARPKEKSIDSLCPNWRIVRVCSAPM